jgi:hypothetical protein
MRARNRLFLIELENSNEEVEAARRVHEIDVRIANLSRQISQLGAETPTHWVNLRKRMLNRELSNLKIERAEVFAFLT